MTFVQAPSSDLDSKELSRRLNLQYDQFSLPMPWAKLYWLTARSYGSVLRKIIHRNGRPTAMRNQELVSSAYESIYDVSNQEYAEKRDARREVFLVKGRPVYTDGWFTFRSYVEVLLKVIDFLEVESVLEVGSGRGKNLALMALRRPELRLDGLELTNHGVRQSRELVKELPPLFLEVAGAKALNQLQSEALKRIRFHQASAHAMHFSDKSFDFTFTSLVLEQMPIHYSQALQEICRVTRKYCAFIEPFSEANDRVGLAYLRKMDYFRASYKEFPKFGLEPIYFTAALPQKIRFKTGLLIARVIT